MSYQMGKNVYVGNHVKTINTKIYKPTMRLCAVDVLPTTLLYLSNVA
jgi:hypothetical protein